MDLGGRATSPALSYVFTGGTGWDMVGDQGEEFVAFADSALPTLRRTAYLLCGDWHHADDAAQEALVKLYRVWPRVERREGVMAYARRTLIHVLVDESRRPWRREVTQAAPPELAHTGADSCRRIDERLVLVQALQQVSPRRRACLVLRYFNDLSVVETARLLGCAAGTVKSQTAKGLDELRTALHLTGVTGIELGEKVTSR
jgi:RNA polymerase sigma-70 factor (sigma-E family)